MRLQGAIACLEVFQDEHVDRVFFLPAFCFMDVVNRPDSMAAPEKRISAFRDGRVCGRENVVNVILHAWGLEFLASPAD